MVHHSGPWVHYGSGWGFTRLPDGSVAIQIRNFAADLAPVIASVRIPPDDWCKIIAALSAFGYEKSTFAAIQNLHTGEPPCAGIPA